MVCETRRIVVFGFGGLKSVKLDFGEVLFVGKDFEGHLADFDIIIYQIGIFKYEFEIGAFRQAVLKDLPSEAIRRENEVGLALERGKTVCLIGSHSEDYVAVAVLKMCRVNYGLINQHEVFRNLQVKRSEFKSFVDDVGATVVGFDKNSVDEIICLAGDIAAGFSKRVERGRVLFIPCVWGSSDIRYISTHIQILAKSLVAYSTKILGEPPNYVEQFQFSKEQYAKEQIERIKRDQVVPLEATIEFYRKMKSILWLGDKPLVNATNNFLECMGFSTEIDEIFEEDLWIKDRGKKLVIVEIKGLNKNLTRQDISKLDEHREAREVPELTGLLVANTFMAADSLLSKDQSFPPNVIEKAVRSNLLITRTIDLSRIFDCFGRESGAKLLETMLGQSGWLTFQDGNINVKKK
jgi:hypothetical protein